MRITEFHTIFTDRIHKEDTYYLMPTNFTDAAR